MIVFILAFIVQGAVTVMGMSYLFLEWWSADQNNYDEFAARASAVLI